MPDIIIAPASEAEAPACLALLPQLRQWPAELLIARRAGELAGAAGVVWRDRSDPSGGFPLAVEVIPAFRRQGVGRALVTAAAEMARGETAGLWSHAELDETSPAAAFALACGFAAARRRHHFRAQVSRVADHVAPLVGRLRARGHVPDDARIAPLREAPLEEAAWLVSAEFGGGPVSAHAMLTGAAGLDLDRSLAVMDGERLAGLVLVRMADGCPEIEAALVAPDWRSGWANAVMVEAIAAVGTAGGVAEFRFHCEETVLATMQLAARSEAVCEATVVRYYRALTS